MESTKEDKLMESNDRLLKLRRTRNKIDVIRILDCVWVNKQCSHLLDPSSIIFRVLEKETVTSPNVDGVPEEKTESISRPALNLQLFTILKTSLSLPENLKIVFLPSGRTSLSFFAFSNF